MSRDALSSALASFLVLFVVFAAVSAETSPEVKQEAEAVGNVRFKITWPDDLDTDVDLWVRAPRGNPVGYSNKQNAVLNLLRDDLGKRTSYDDENYEDAVTRGIVPGEYCVNTHLYSNRARKLPIVVTVKVEVTSGKGTKASTEPIFRTSNTHVSKGTELNAACLELDEQGKLVEGSVYSSQSVKLRSFQQEG